MNRRAFLKRTSIATAAMATSSWFTFSCDSRQKAPNIVLVYADDLGYGDVSCYGATGVNTPHIDRLAAQGIRFTEAYATSATCTPSRYSLLTGEYAWRRKDTGIASGDAPLIIPEDKLTLADMLYEAGYISGVVGKWHLGLGRGKPDWNGELKPGPLELGFDYCYLVPATGDRVPCVYVENHRVVNLDPDDPIQVSFQENVGNEPTGVTHPERLKVQADRQHSDTIVNGNSPIVLYGHPINNAQYRDYGQVPFSEVIKHSINTGIIRVSQELGERDLYHFLTKVGFGSKTGVELPGEESGQLKHYSDWSGLSIGSIPIGQGISVTGLQLATKMASIANGGNLVKPTIINKVKNTEGKTISLLNRQNTIMGRIATAESVSEMKGMLRTVVKDGTGQDAAIPGYKVSGKTGTAQKPAKGGYAEGRYISSFAGYFPEDNPRYLILIVIDEVGTRPVWGGATAGKVFKEVGTRIIKSVEN